MNTPGKRILIVEDGQTLNRMIQFLLRSRGYIIEYAYDGMEALEVLKKNTPHAIILDLMMPKMNGYKLLEKLKKDDQHKRTPIIILSSLDAGTNSKKLLSMGACDYIEKPFMSAAFLEKVSNALATSVN